MTLLGRWLVNAIPPLCTRPHRETVNGIPRLPLTLAAIKYVVYVHTYMYTYVVTLHTCYYQTSNCYSTIDTLLTMVRLKKLMRFRSCAGLQKFNGEIFPISRSLIPLLLSMTVAVEERTTWLVTIKKVGLPP